MDRRIERSKKAIKCALTELVLEKGFENITAGQVASKAGVNRSTIYLHYSSLDYILYDIEDEVIKDIMKSAFMLTDDFSLYINRLALAILGQKEKIRAVLSSCYAHFLKKLEGAIFPLINMSRFGGTLFTKEEEKLLLIFLLDGSIGVIDSYLKTHHDPDVKEVEHLVESFISFFRDPIFQEKK